MKQIFLAVICACAGFWLTAPAFAEDCPETPTEQAETLSVSLEKLLEGGQVEFVGYTARKLAGIHSDNCASLKLFQTLYLDASSKIEASEMRTYQTVYKMTKVKAWHPEREAALGKTGECVVTFDLPKAGFAQNVRQDCTSNAFHNPAKEAFAKVLFAPSDMDAEFVPATDLTYTVKFDLAWKKKR